MAYPIETQKIRTPTPAHLISSHLVRDSSISMSKSNSLMMHTLQETDVPLIIVMARPHAHAEYSQNTMLRSSRHKMNWRSQNRFIGVFLDCHVQTDN